jgi:hypothetical protein
MFNVIRNSLCLTYDQSLVDELLAAYTEAKHRFHVGDLRPNAVEAGRFSEAAFRILQQRAFGAFEPLGNKIDTDSVIVRLAQLPRGTQPDSVRLHMPRALRVVYDIRNNRDAAHLADGIDPNLQDASLVVAALDWILAELLRLHHNVSANEAQRIVQDLVTHPVPSIQDFNGIPVVLRTDWGRDDVVLVLLYRAGLGGLQWHELLRALPRKVDGSLETALRYLVNDKAFVYFDRETGSHKITATGQKYVDSRKLLNP